MFEHSIRRKRDYIFRALPFALAALIALGFSNFPFHSFEFLTYDMRLRLAPDPETSGHISLVTWDRAAITKVGGKPSAKDYAGLIHELSKTPMKTVVLVTSPDRLPGTSAEKQLLADELALLPSVYVVFDPLSVPLPGESAKLALPAPFEKLRVVNGPISRDLKNFAADDVARRALIYGDHRYVLQAEVAQRITAIEKPEDYRGAFDFRGYLQTYVPYREKGAYPRVTVGSILEGTAKLANLRDKIVLVGMDSETDTDDYVKTPHSRDILALPLIEAHANIIDTFILNSGIQKTPDWVDLFITISLSILVAYVVFSLKPAQGVLILVASLLSFSSLAYAAFALGGLWVTMAHPLLSAFTCYYLFIPYRLILEYRKRWEYQQKNKLLTEVEELKTNFLSMMSHDLKTPLARIKGMAELVSRDKTNLSPQQDQALHQIENSTDELNEFISSILCLGRVESKEIKLQLQSRDVNSLLDDVLKKYRYLAEERGITIRTEYEPLFSVRMDLDLMRQVFANLIENAIKYSPDNSSILVSTEEVDGHILVQVADQGLGIPRDEIEHIFMKFYRSRHAKNSPIKGSGLGLYLAKYFVELHRGRLVVESVHQQGSTFSVRLPLDV